VYSSQTSAALEQVRKQIKEDQTRSKPRGVADEDSSETRDRERWVSLPKHLAQYTEERAVVSQGWLWTHRLDRRHATTDSQGTKHIPVRLVCLGPVAALDPNYEPKIKVWDNGLLKVTKSLILCLAQVPADLVTLWHLRRVILIPPWAGQRLRWMMT
jgi:hypothetical protein